VTYSDMITLLMACFIMIITFSSKESEKFNKKRDSLAGGPGGSGAAGDPKSGLDSDSVVWRLRPPSARVSKNGSEMPALYSDPAMEATAAEVLKALEGPPIGTMRDSYTIRVPGPLLFLDDKALAPSGVRILGAAAHMVRPLPFDVLIEVEDPEALPKAVLAASYLEHQQGLIPARLGVGCHAPSAGVDHAVWLVFSRQQ
jgi:hypothetical protein